MEKKEQLYEGKAKKVFATDNQDYVIVSYKDDATAFNGLKKGTIAGKGVINNKMSNLMMQMLEKKGIPTHFEKVPLEVIIRNVAAGSFSKRYGVAEGTKFSAPTIEFSYKNDDLGDPLINDYHALALNLATAEEIDTIKKMAFAVNDAMIEFFKKLNIDLIDFKLEFGRFKGQIVLADEISPDTCRFWEAGSWDTTKHVSLDKDRFRRDLGGVEDAYKEIFKRLTGE